MEGVLQLSGYQLTPEAHNSLSWLNKVTDYELAPQSDKRDITVSAWDEKQGDPASNPHSAMNLTEGL